MPSAGDTSWRVPLRFMRGSFGGGAPSVYAAHCRLRVERRTVPGETAGDALAEVQCILDDLKASDATFEADARVAFARDPLETPAEAPVAEVVRASAADVLGTPVPDVGASFWTDAALLAATGTETVVFGPAAPLADARELSVQDPVGPNSTWNGFGEIVPGRRIDYVFTREPVRVLAHTLIAEQIPGADRFPSDHLPVLIKARIAN